MRTAQIFLFVGLYSLIACEAPECRPNGDDGTFLITAKQMTGGPMLPASCAPGTPVSFYLGRTDDDVRVARALSIDVVNGATPMRVPIFDGEGILCLDRGQFHDCITIRADSAHPSVEIQVLEPGISWVPSGVEIVSQETYTENTELDVCANAARAQACQDLSRILELCVEMSARGCLDSTTETENAFIGCISNSCGGSNDCTSACPLNP